MDRLVRGFHPIETLLKLGTQHDAIETNCVIRALDAAEPAEIPCRDRAEHRMVVRVSGLLFFPMLPERGRVIFQHPFP